MFDQPATISDGLRAAAAACPNKAAIIDEQGQLNYREFDAQVDALATFLVKAGLDRGASAAYLLWDQRELLISYHAITRISSVLVSLNYRLTPAELAHQLSASDARFLIYDSAFARVIDDTVALMQWPIRLIQVGATASSRVTTFQEAITEPVAPALLQERLPSPDDIAGIWFTSGTEGRPKGAVVRHRSAIAAAMISANIIGFGRDARCLAVAPLFHRGAAENIALAITMAGATHYLQLRFNPPAVLQALREHKITVAFIVPTMAKMMLRELTTEHHDLPDLEHWVSASAPLPVTLENEVRRRFNLKGGIMNVYGITEMLVIAGCQTYPGDTYTGAAGPPATNMQVRIHDEQRGFLPPGEVGEIIARGPCAFSHYLNDVEATKKAAMLVDGVSWYRTGDVGTLDADGNLTILDRKKDMILSGGENIYSAEVEAAILTHPAVVEVAVIGRPDDQWGEIVVAFIVLSAVPEPTLADIRSACLELASYKHPREIIIVEALPRNTFGKVQKAELKLRLAPPACISI